jgi:membrane dipeptidase
MKKKLILIVFVALVLVLMRGSASFMLDRFAMGTIIPKPYTVSPEANKLHQSFDFVADLHSDALAGHRNLMKKSNAGHVDFPRMREGNVAFQLFTVYSSVPPTMLNADDEGSVFDNHPSDFSIDLAGVQSFFNLENPRCWLSSTQRAFRQFDKLNAFAQKDSFFHIIKSKADLEDFLKLRAIDRRHVSGMLGIEGIQCLNGDLNNLDIFYEKGVRTIGIAHFFSNEYGGSRHGEEKYGLTVAGEQLIDKMNELGIFADISHDAEPLMWDVLQRISLPPFISHGGSAGMLESQRFISDDILKEVAARDGIIGVIFFHPFERKGATIQDIVEQVLYLKELVGVKHIALGSDFDGMTYTPFDVSGMALLTEALIDAGLKDDEIKAVMGENVKNFFLKYLR